MSNPRDLVQLRALYQSGLLTEDEYTDARRRLLGYKVKRGRPVPPARAPESAAATGPARDSGAPRNGNRARPADRRSVNARAQDPPRNPNSDLPLMFALGALALVAIAATIWFLMG